MAQNSTRRNRSTSSQSHKAAKEQRAIILFALVVANIFIGVPFLCLGGFILNFAGKELVLAEKSVKWLATSGMIEKSGLEEVDDGDGGSSIRAKIRYTYAVNGQTYTSDRVMFGDYGEADRSHAQGMISQYPVDKEVPVYYDPAKPDEAVLKQGVHFGVYFSIGMGALFLFLGAFLILALLLLFSLKPGETEKNLTGATRRN